MGTVTRYGVMKQAEIFMEWDDGEVRKICTLELMMNEDELKLSEENMQRIRRRLGWEIIREGARILLWKAHFVEGK